MNTVLNIIELVVIVAVLGFLVYKAIKVFRPLIKNPQFIQLILEKIGEAELTARSGSAKLSYVSDALVAYCEKNKLAFTRADLEKIVNLVVAGANLVRNFVKK